MKNIYFTIVSLMGLVVVCATGCVKPPVISTAPVIDIDGNGYDTVRIGTQTWLVENLKTTHYRNGDAVQFVSGTGIWDGLTTGAFCIYNNDASIANTYGCLYNYQAATDLRNIAPLGWRVPTLADWNTLMAYYGGGSPLNGSLVAGGKLKEAGTAHWNAPNTGADNSSGFNALPGGGRLHNDIFNNVGQYAVFWSNTSSTTNDNYFELGYNYTGIAGGNSTGTTLGLSIRCIKE